MIEFFKKIQRIQRDPKKVSIVKLFEAEKERAKLFAVYDRAAFEMEAHCDDIDDIFNTKLLEDYIIFYNAQKNMLGLSYGQLDDIKEYLINLKEWCKEEAKVCDEQRVERGAQREQLHKDETFFTKNQFAYILNSSPELIQVIIQVGLQKDVDQTTMINSFVNLFREALPPSEPLSNVLKTNNIEHKAEDNTIDVRVFIKDNFDMIGMILLEDIRNKELLISLGGVLSSLEQLSKAKTDQN